MHLWTPYQRSKFHWRNFPILPLRLVRIHQLQTIAVLQREIHSWACEWEGNSRPYQILALLLFGLKLWLTFRLLHDWTRVHDVGSNWSRKVLLTAIHTYFHSTTVRLMYGLLELGEVDQKLHFMPRPATLEGAFWTFRWLCCSAMPEAVGKPFVHLFDFFRFTGVIPRHFLHISFGKGLTVNRLILFQIEHSV